MIDADEVARLCYERFGQLARRGKPEPGREWTLLAAVLRVCRGPDPDPGTGTGTAEKEIVSMGTGTKCIGKTAMSPNGDVLNDSHAEVIARRGCIRYLIQELRRAVSGQSSSVFCPSAQRGKWKLRPGVSFLLFTSHTPCGDASIIPMTDFQSQPCPPVTSVKSSEGADGGGNLKRKAEEQGEGHKLKSALVVDRGPAESPQKDIEQPESWNPARNLLKTPSEAASRAEGQPEITSSSCTDTSQADDAGEHPQVPDIHRTGAKCVPGGPADLLLPGMGYHNTGALRVKPGRGEPTLSLSCSDKLARWGVLGFQGALLSHYLEEGLYFSTVVVGQCPCSQEVIHRALVSRCFHVSNLPAGFSLCSPVLLQSSLEFPFSQTQTKLQHHASQGRISPCGAAISWCNVAEQPLDVTANGYKHGVTKRDLGTPKARSLLCKLELFHSFLSLVAATEPSALPDSLRTVDLHSYWDYKQASQSYQRAWHQLRSQAFPLWPRGDRKLLLFH
ncbi:tRNA-specific adenosine deaminase 1 isoform X2 [Cololabis saira]|uniref:tRNA-specific adenosine deaminase 1 isoform X2 n=1 Tax=Cololabis saira TaxID=129043 RepID=UPI002AD3826E|nr:tRNA-specific adenosine deaminase 1 isoform X2 [Cololabis saira]